MSKQSITLNDKLLVLKKLLIIGRTYPEPSTTAAGRRMMDIIDFFQKEAYQIHFCTTAKLSERSFNLGILNIETSEVELNKDSFNDFLKKIAADVVLFDRFITEEQFGWRVSEVLPNALKILDTEDLHFLRKSREVALKSNLEFNRKSLFNDETKRELASILRCDLSLIISDYEMNLLKDQFKIPSKLLLYFPFLVEENMALLHNPFQLRKNFVCIGNLHHGPNRDAVLFLKREVWPLIRKELPKAELHIYGAYAPQQIQELHHPQSGFFIDGWVEDAPKALLESRVCLAPLRFGAGLKGKLLEAMMCSTPVISTSIGAEGMYGDYDIPGFIADDAEAFAKQAISLYQNEELWLSKLKSIKEILSSRFSKEKYTKIFQNRIAALMLDLEQHRQEHFLGQILNHQSLQSTKYLSKWISAKNSK